MCDTLSLHDALPISTKKALNIYQENLKYFNDDYLRGICFLEQGLIHMYLRRISKGYADSIYHNTNFVYDTDNLLFVNEKDNQIEVPEPFSHNVLLFKDVKDLLSNFNLDKYYSYHFLGMSKSSPLSMSLVIHKLLNYMKLEELITIEQELDVKNKDFVKKYIEYTN
jgi:hypothetical protein